MMAVSTVVGGTWIWPLVCNAISIIVQSCIQYFIAYGLHRPEGTLSEKVVLFLQL